MPTINGLTYFEVQFDEAGSLTADGGLRAAVAGGGISDLFVMSHGWNNGIESARDLYNAMFKLLAEQLGAHRAACAAVGILWPSLLFPEDDPSTKSAPSTGAQLAAALAPAFPDKTKQLTTLGELLDKQPQRLDKLTEFHSLVAELVTTDPLGSEDAGESALLRADTITVLGHAAAMASAPAPAARDRGNPFAGLWSGARELLRTMSYYEMKNRAGVVGQNGLGPLLGGLGGPGGTPRVHLMGHSFGARLVAYALAGLPDGQTGASSPVKSLTLLQGAFSHFAFASPLPIDGGRNGALAGLSDRVDGPLLATFTDADRAVGWWYPAASMLARQDSKAASDLVYRWGAMGHDGYQQNPAAAITPMVAQGQSYDFAPGRFYALDANAVIKANQSKFSGAHSDIRHAEVLWAVLCAAGLDH
ncbi:MAG: serine/threonine protein kinase [Candidatus Sericytochromatia bacterium]